MRSWPPGCMDYGYWPDDDPTPESGIPALVDAECDRLIALLGVAPPSTLSGRDATADEVAAELRELESLRSSHRRSRWAITELWIVIAGMLVVLFATGWWPLVLPVVAFTLAAVHRANARDVSKARGRELDAAVADARGRLAEIRGQQ